MEEDDESCCDERLAELWGELPVELLWLARLVTLGDGAGDGDDVGYGIIMAATSLQP